MSKAGDFCPCARTRSQSSASSWNHGPAGGAPLPSAAATISGWLYSRRTASARAFSASPSAAVSQAQYAEIFEAVVAALAEVVSEQPDAAEELRGRTFARTLH